MLPTFCNEFIGVAVTFPVRQGFNDDFFTGTVLSIIIDDGTPSPPKLKARRSFVHLDNP
jgi:hypothetical protein